MLQRNPNRYRLLRSALLTALLLPALGACGEQPGMGQGVTTLSGDPGVANASPPPRSTPRRNDAPTPRPTIVVPEVVNEVAVVRLIDELRARGVAMEPDADSRVGLLRDTPGQVYTGTFGGWLHVHRYASAEAAARDVPRITREFEAGLPIMEWVDAVHLYRRDALVLLYLGKDPQMLAPLIELCGPQFAGHPLVPPTPEPTELPLTSIERAMPALVNRMGLGEVSRITKLAELPLDSGVALVFSFDLDTKDGPASGTHIAYLDWRAPLWYPDGGTSELAEASASAPPVQALGGTYVVNGGPDTPERPDSVSLVGGKVSDPAVHRVVATFGDGTQQTVPIEGGTYLAAKLDAGSIRAITALDRDGTELHQVAIER